MLNDQRAIVVSTSSRDHEEDHDHDEDQDHEHIIREIHALTPPHPPAPSSINRGRRRETWETNSDHRSSSLSTTSSENFSTMSREFNALVIAGSTIGNHGSDQNDGMMNNMNMNLSRIGEDETTPHEMETNPLAIVPDNSQPLDPIPSPSRHVITSGGSSSSGNGGGNHRGEVSVQRVKKEEVESKINAWQTAKIAKLNNRFKREDAIINGCESEEIQKATTWMKKVERKLEEKRARAMEKMQNDIAKARRKAEEKRASAEAKRGTKVARVIEIANLMRAVGRAPVKRSFF